MTVKRKVKFEGVPYEGNLEELIIQALLEKQGVDIHCVNLKKINHAYFDYFIVCTGTSKPHVETLCDFVQEQTQRVAGVKPLHVEGLENKEWVLLDYLNIISSNPFGAMLRCRSFEGRGSRVKGQGNRE